MAKNTIIVSVLADTKPLASGFKGVLGTIGTIGAGVAKATAGIGAAIGGIAIAGGFSRAMKLDEARTQLNALGYDTQRIDGIMSSALQSVKGTAFGLDSAATIAANALASGVPEGERLTKALTTVANTAALAKVDMGEMGAVFQKVWANGKITTSEMNQLADRGVPIWQFLSQAMGVSNEALREMIEKGEVTADMFESALGPAVEGMATKMSGSFRGMAANSIAALSRLGAMFAGPLLEAGKRFLGESTILVDGLGERLAPVAAQFAAWLGSFNSDGLAGNVLAFFDRIIAFIPSLFTVGAPMTEIGASLQKLGPAFAAFGEQLPAIGSAVATLAASGISVLADVLGFLADNVDTIIQFMPAIVGGFLLWRAASTAAATASFSLRAAELAALPVYFANNVMRLTSVNLERRLALAKGVSTGATLTNTAALGGSRVAMLASTAATTAATVAQRGLNFAMIANPIGIIVTAIAALVAGLIWFFTQTELGQAIWREFTRFLGEAWANIVSVATTVFTNLASFFTDVWNGIVAFLTPVFEVIATIIRVYVETWVNIIIVFAAVLKTIWDGIVSVVTTVWNAIVAFLTPIVTNIVSFITTAIQTLNSVWSAVWGAVSSFFMGIWNGIVSFLSPIVNRVVATVRGPVQSLVGWWSGVWSAISSFFSNAWNGMVGAVSSAVNQIVGVVRSIFGIVMGALGNVGSWLLSAGSDLVRGFWNGVSGMLGWLQSRVTGFFDGVIGWAKGVLGIQSPSKVFRGIGEFLGQGLGQGIDRSRSLVNRSVGRLADSVTDGFNARLDGNQLQLAVTGTGSSNAPAPVYHITVQALAPTPEIGRSVVSAIREYERAGGRR